jgi:valyl-tRNA synthetase
MTDEAPAKYRRMTREECRRAVVADLETQGLIEKITPYRHAVGHNERTGTVIEPLLSEQWFVKMKPLAEPAIEAVRSGKVRFHPAHWEKTYFHWLENVRDWCISRQIWWGHRIPIWTCRDCGEVIVAADAPERCPTCHSQKLEQDPDVLDTWFSSWLWPFSTLGWPDDTEDLRHFFPTDVLITGPDIIFLWVARMIMSSLEVKGEVPFRDVYYTGMVRDIRGRKMSKSLGNSSDPLKVIAESHRRLWSGCDAVHHCLPDSSRWRYSLRRFLVRNGTQFREQDLECHALHADEPGGGGRFSFCSH